MSTLADTTSSTVAYYSSTRILVIPVGSTEQHGPHLPLDTDTQITQALVDFLAQKKPEDVVVAPALPYGASGEHQSFAGTLSIGNDALHRVIVELVRSASHWRGVYIVSAHGGNAPILTSTVAQLRRESRAVDLWYPTRATLQEAGFKWEIAASATGLYQPDLHAGRTETSIMLALNPESVKMQYAIAGQGDESPYTISTMQNFGVQAVSANGILGDPTGANYEEGCLLLGAMTDALMSHFEASKIWPPR